jgi:hypothetical protein
MGMGMTTSSTTVTISGAVTTSPNLPQPLATQTPVYGTCEAAASGTTVYTVTAGKTFYCTGILISTAGTQNAHILDAGVQKMVCYTTANLPVCVSGGVLFTAAAGHAITITAAAGGNSCTIWGYEV